MAVGDSFVAVVGSAATSRQPASGVFERVNFIVKPSNTDGTYAYDGSNLANMFGAPNRTSLDIIDGNQMGPQPFKMCIIIGNTHYIHKYGTTDKVVWGGVQIDA